MDIFTQWYDKIIDFAKQKLDIVLWFFISSAILLFTPNDYLRVIHLEDLAKFIAPFSGLIFVLSGVLIFINMANSGKQYFQARREIQHELNQRRTLLKQLEEIYNINELKSGFKSQQDCIAWANKVAPLLKFNNQYYNNFMERSYKLNFVGISYQLGGSLLNNMVSQLEMAIYDLKQDISHLESK